MRHSRCVWLPLDLLLIDSGREGVGCGMWCMWGGLRLCDEETDIFGDFICKS